MKVVIKKLLKKLIMKVKQYKDVLSKPLIEENPITLQILGICSALAVTSNLSVTLVMCVALTSVVSFSNLFISLIRNLSLIHISEPTRRRGM